jgi:23S rRNA (pseudouridine1915-N3)-methyltransferase
VRLSIIAVGHMKSGPERELADRYMDRIAKTAGQVGMGFGTMTEHSESRARDGETRKREEAKLILADIGEGTRLMAFDERGKPIDSESFAIKIAGWRDAGTRNLACVIGGADGLHEDVRQKADMIVSFGAMTIPHQLVRVLICEQLYRTVTILSGHPYHRT